MVSSSFAIGVLGYSTFALGFVDAILVCFFFNLLGVLTVCWFSCFGPAFGLRQMVLSRFWFGYWPTKISKFPVPVRLPPSYAYTLCYSCPSERSLLFGLVRRQLHRRRPAS